jgi:hypothetical protein
MTRNILMFVVACSGLCLHWCMCTAYNCTSEVLDSTLCNNILFRGGGSAVRRCTTQDGAQGVHLEQAVRQAGTDHGG